MLVENDKITNLTARHNATNHISKIFINSDLESMPYSRICLKNFKSCVDTIYFSSIFFIES